MVIRGAQGGQVISSTTFSTGETSATIMELGEHPTTEHHGDPPRPVDEEGDFIMEVDGDQQDLPEEGGHSAAPA